MSYALEAELTETGPTVSRGDAFGAKVSISGNTAVVGTDFGDIYVYTEGKSGWADMTQTAVLTSGLIRRGSGVNVSIDGDTIVAEGLGSNHVGDILVFNEPATGWANIAPTAIFTDSDGETLGDPSISGDTIAAGAASTTGESVDVFSKPASGWRDMTQTAVLTDSKGFYIFNNVSVSGSEVVASATVKDGSDTVDVFTEPSSGWANMTETAVLSDSSGASLVDSNISGNTVVANAPYYYGSGGGTHGFADVFVEPNTGWKNGTQTGRLTGSSATLSQYISTSNAITAGTIVLGTPGPDDGSSTHPAALVFTEPSSGWRNMTQTAELLEPSNILDNSAFTTAVSTTSGNTVLVGYHADYGLYGAATVFGVKGAPSVILDPASQNVAAGQTATFTADASGSPTPTVQWQMSTDQGKTFMDISGAITATYSLVASPGENNYQYRAVFTNSLGTATTTAAVLTVSSTTLIAPKVTLNPANQTVVAGATATFTAAASGSPTPTVQWQVSSNAGKTFASISGATSLTYSFKTTASETGYEYRAVFTNSKGTATSTAATLTVTVPATKLVFDTQPTTGTAGVALSPIITVKVEDASGNLVTSNTSSVTLSLATFPKGGTLTGTATVKVVNGIATFTGLSLKIAGAYTLKATDGSLTSAVSKAITIAPAAAAKLVIATQPTTGTAGVALSPIITVDVEDAFGNIVTTNTSTVTLALATFPKGGTLTGTAAVKVVKGVATFTGLSLKIAGAYTLKATDGSLTSATSKTITVAPAAAAKLVIFEQPTAGTHGVTLSPGFVVDVEDAFGNIVITDASTVTLAISSGPAGGTLAGTTSVKAVKGVASFGALSVSKAGTYVLKVSDGKLTTAVSKSVVVK